MMDRGLSIRGIISLGMSLVTGRNLVPSPATGKMRLSDGGMSFNYLACYFKYSIFKHVSCGRWSSRSLDSAMIRSKAQCQMGAVASYLPASSFIAVFQPF